MEEHGDRIVNGTNATQGQFPFIVSLSIVESKVVEHFCGGSIITKFWSLTAAHCIRAEIEILIDKDVIKVLGNSHIVNKSTQHDINCYKIHSKYDELQNTNDIALIRVKQPFNGTYEKIIALPPRNFKYENDQIVTIMGWGALNFEGKLPNVLQYVQLRLIDNTVCQKIYDQIPQKNYLIKPDVMVCAGETTTDSCQGDSGGPLVLELRQGGVRHKYQIGIVSWGEGCGSGFPGVYVRVTKYISWMKGIIKKHNSGCKSKCITRRRNT
ncbi:hypothetical protein ILUMI_24698 [Ignelater luminosus]|uniref:Peptidase S1 domain-containing protein n=1 Tax=Ignelater luminosus TaxID=2038154 RepID=A0A8K0C5T8_IGNLU|nr:hypothetical protein ILUMI_24698 [Ignelater luminosus]